MNTEKSSRQADKPKRKNTDLLVIIIGGIIINIACFLMCSITGHCATAVDSVLPYMVNTQDGYSLTQEEYSMIIGILADNNYTLGDNVIIFKKYDYNWYTYNDYIQVPSYDVWDLSSTDLNGTFSSGYSYSTFEFNNNSSYYNSSVSSSIGYSIQKNAIGGVHWYVSKQTGQADFRLFGSTTPVNIQNGYFTGSYIPYYPVYCSTNFYTSGGDTVLSALTPINPTSSQFSDAPLITGHALPSQPTAPTFTPPSYDSSLTFVENVKVFIQWLGQYIGNLIVWLVQSLYDFLDKLIQNLKNFFNAVITAINNGFMNIYQNIVTLFQPFFQVVTDFYNSVLDSLGEETLGNIKDSITTIKENLVSFRQSFLSFVDFCQTVMAQYGVIWNKQTFIDAWDNSTFIQGNIGFARAFSDFRTAMLNVNELEHITFQLDFRNSYYNFGQCELSFDWLIPYKGAIRGVIWFIVWLNFANFFFDEAPNFLSGGGSNKKGDK